EAMAMIRQRISRTDDTTIYRIVVEELIPYSRTRRDPNELTRPAIVRRLNRMTTFVWGRGSSRKPCGFISFMVRDRRLMIDMLAMERGYQSRGLGAQLLQAAERYGRTHQCTAALLYVDEGNMRAHRFYERQGCALDGYVPSLRCF